MQGRTRIERGNVVAGYRVLEELGRGGSATVWSAEHVEDGSAAAIKVATLPGEVAGGLFRREASLAARLRHPAIVRLYTGGHLEDGRSFLVFERIDGESLEARGDRLDLAAILSVGAQLFDALGYAHDAGVIHCDVKPANVLVEGEDAGGRLRIKLADFGLAATREPTRLGRDAIPLIAGTPGFLSPEQARGAGHLSPSTDLWGGGALLYHLISGHAPHFGKSILEVVERTLAEPPLPLLPRLGLEVPDALSSLVYRLLARDPAFRPATAYRARDVLRDLLAGLSARPSRPPGPSGPGAPATQRERPRPADDASETLAVPSTALMATPLGMPVSRFGRRAAKLTAREPILAALYEALGPVGADAESSQPATCVLVAPRGAGSTRVVDELSLRLQSAGRPVFAVTGRRGTTSPPYEVLAALAVELCGAGGAGSAFGAAEQLGRALTDAGLHDDDPGRDALVAGVVGSGVPAETGATQVRAFRAFDKLLGASTHERSVLVVDGADDADAESLSVLDALCRAEAGRAPPPRVLRVMRSEPPADPSGRTRVFTLDALTEPEAVTLLSALAERADADVARLARAVGGLPSELCAAAANLLATGAPASDPASLLDRRLDASDPGVVAVLEAAVAYEGDIPGRSLAAAALALGAAAERDAAERLVQLAVLEGWLARVPRSACRLEPSLRFPSERVRAHVRARVEPRRLLRASRAATTWLARESRDVAEGTQARLGALAEAAGESAVAAHAFWEAGRIGAVGRAARHLTRALTLARADAEAAEAVDEPAILCRLAELANESGEAESAELLAHDGLARVESERPVLTARLRRAVATSLTRRGRSADALAPLERALEELGEEGDPVQRASVLAEQGWILGYLLGDNARGIALGRRALEVAARVDAPSFQASLCGRLGANYLRAGDWDGQLGANLRDLGLSAEAGDTGGLIRANINLGVCYTNRGLCALARAHTEEALRLSQRHGRLSSAQIALNNLAMIAADEGRWDEAAALVTATFENARRTGENRALGEARCTLARERMARGDLDAAGEALEAALATDSAAELELATRLSGLLFLLRGDALGGEACLRALVESPEVDPYERACTRLALAGALGERGQREAAARETAAASERLWRLGADPAHEARRWAPPGQRPGR